MLWSNIRHRQQLRFKKKGLDRILIVIIYHTKEVCIFCLIIIQDKILFFVLKEVD